MIRCANVEVINNRRQLISFLIGLTVCVSIWSILATKVTISNKYQSPAPSSKLYNYQVGDHVIRGSSHHSRQLNGQKEQITTEMNSINGKNYFKNDSLKNNDYNRSLDSYPFSAVSYEALPKDDRSNLIDLNNFEFIINQKSCRNSSSPLLLIFIHSAPGNYQKRLLIRKTWGSVTDTATNNVRPLFLLGTVTETADQKSLENENQMYSDIVQGSFIDHYRNMTYKHVMALKWFTYYCPNAKYILKTDDDIFVHTPNLINYLSTVAERNDLLFCRYQNRQHVERNESKWYVSEKEYSGDYYSAYCRGYSILYSPDVAFRLYLEAQKTPYFWIDDVHVTGTLALQANITIKSFLPVLLKQNKLEDIMAGKTDINAIPFLFVWQGITEDQIKKLWGLLSIKKKII